MSKAKLTKLNVVSGERGLSFGSRLAVGLKIVEQCIWERTSGAHLVQPLERGYLGMAPALNLWAL